MGKAVYKADEVALAKLLAAMSGNSIAPDFNGSVVDIKTPAPTFETTSVTPE